MEDNEILRLSITKNGVTVLWNEAIADDEMEELLDPDSKVFDYKELVTLGTGIGSYIATREELDKKTAVMSILSAILVGIKQTEKAMEDGHIKVERATEDVVVDDEFDEEDYE